MPTDIVTILGAGGHAKVVLDAARRVWPHRAFEVFDDDPRKAGQTLLDAPVRIPIDWTAISPVVHVAIGDNRVRQQLYGRGRDAGIVLVSVVHPAATVATQAEMGEGCFIAARAIIAPCASLGAGVIANHGCIVDHDCVVGDWCHIGPGVILGGGVHVGHGCLIGSGAVILPGRSIGAGTTVGAGAVVTRDLGPRIVAYGVPARVRGTRT